MSELDEAANHGELDELAAWKQTHELPYLGAVIAEAGRIHPPFGLPFEREVPAHGAVICGQPLNGGTIVGMSAWVAHRDASIFGADCDQWNPDRWLCEPEKRKKMDGCLLTVRHTVLQFPEVSPIHQETWLMTRSSLALVTDHALERTSRC